MEDAKLQLAERLKTANNVLVSVSRNPSVDQLSACIGLALLLNKQGKHTAAVFSGQVPSTIEFLKPEDTLEKNTDSLRDFIIALDKSKADKLRYKVEDNVVRIFITPYKTSISETDLDFSQGDFNVDVVIALGVLQQEDLDEAITAHGRILHDATVASITTAVDGGLGTINWHDSQASSLSELVTELAQIIDPTLLDEQISTALLTGIVSETERFRNEKTSPQTMSISAALMAAGANQQLVASQLETTKEAPKTEVEDDLDEEPAPPEDGTIEIDHQKDQQKDQKSEAEADDSPADATPQPAEPPVEDAMPAPEEPASPNVDTLPSEQPPANNTPGLSSMSPGSQLITEPPTLGGTLTANSSEEQLDPATDPLSLPKTDAPQLLERKNQAAAKTSAPPPDDSDLNEVRDEVQEALAGSTANDNDFPKPVESLNAQPLGNDLHPGEAAAKDQGTVTDPNAPPPVPPPIPFQFTPPAQTDDNKNS